MDIPTIGRILEFHSPFAPVRPCIVTAVGERMVTVTVTVFDGGTGSGAFSGGTVPFFEFEQRSTSSQGECYACWPHRYDRESGVQPFPPSMDELMATDKVPPEHETEDKAEDKFLPPKK